MRKTTRGIVRRRMGIQLLQTLLLLIGLCFGVRMPNVHAQTVSTCSSHGNLVYEGKRGSVALYAADIRLLEEKISTIPERCFDPVCYAHTHNWEYCRINEKTHTRHCTDCGEANDLTSSHRADSWERDTFFYEGKAYPGKRFTCVCGYQWSMELSHTMIFEVLDEVNHHSRCALDGTPYCRGCEPSVEEHYAWYYEMGDDEFHHEKICFDCGFQIEETCCFDVAEDEEGRHACICGRREKREEESETSDEPETGEHPGDPDEPGAEDVPETPDEPGTEDVPETPDEPGTEDAPETPDAPEINDPSETPDEPETGGVPETPALPGTGDAPVAPEMSALPGAGDTLIPDPIRID